MVRMDHSITCRVITIAGGVKNEFRAGLRGFREVGKAMNRAEPAAAHAAATHSIAATAAAPTVETFDPILLSVISSRIELIIREMTNTVMKASRSSVIKNARDMSCGILTYDSRLVCVEEALPIHITALELTTRPIVELFEDIKEGDAYLNNSPFYGGTHHADLTLCVPVFFEGEPLFWTLARSHHADIGAPEPTTYLPYAKTIYEEGMHFPCVRSQENFKDKADIIRMGMQKIRVNNIWYGDYRAQVGACRTGERRLKELAAQYGAAMIKAFIEAWMDYGERRAIAAIRQLPAGSFTYEVRHDPVPGVCDEGIPIRATVTIDPEAGLITVDARDNPDCVPGGLNLSEACATAACRIGVFYNIDFEHAAQPRQRRAHRPAAARRLRRRPAAASHRHLLRHQQLHGAPGQCGAMLLRPDRQALWHGRGRGQFLRRARRRLRRRQPPLGAGGLYHPAHDGALRRARPRGLRRLAHL